MLRVGIIDSMWGLVSLLVLAILICFVVLWLFNKRIDYVAGKREPMDFETWCEENEDEIMIELAETGADREMCFDCELELEKRYLHYLEYY